MAYMPDGLEGRPQYALKHAVLASISLAFLAFGFFMDGPAAVMRGLLRIVEEPAVLITDYIAVGGIGAAFVNAGLLMLLCAAMLFALRVDIGGISVASVFLVGGFALFGKNLLNVWPVIFGAFLYARVRGEPFAKYVHTALLATSFAPVVTEFLFVVDLPLALRLPLALISGASVGFLIAPVSAGALKLHRGLTLYNVGFSVGILGTVYVSVFKSYGYKAYTRLVWSTGATTPLGLFSAALFVLMIAAALVIDRGAPAKAARIFRYPGTLGSDFIAREGFAQALVNMGLNGLVATAYVLLVGGPLNGPTLGGILAVAGFGAFGKHLKNILPIFAGVIIGGLTKNWNINDPSILFAALFGTSLAPIAGHYGWFWGVVAGFVNSSVVLHCGVLHGGMNLYNTGFSAGIVAAVMVPILDSFKKKERRQAMRSVDPPLDA